MTRLLCRPDPCRDFVDDYDDTIVNCYKYEAHAKIPPQILKRMAGKTGLKVLDVGCGTGLLARPFFADSDTHEVTGIDATPEMTAAASKLPYKRMITSRVQEALAGELKSETYDVILLVGMLEFIDDPPTFVTTVASFLAEGGLLAIGAPHKQSFALERKFGILTHPFEPMEAALRHAGLEQEWSEDMNGYTLNDGATNVKYRGAIWRARA
jgi:predicted TPR repeat methyltransferase